MESKRSRTTRRAASTFLAHPYGHDIQRGKHHLHGRRRSRYALADKKVSILRSVFLATHATLESRQLARGGECQRTFRLGVAGAVLEMKWKCER